MSWSAIDLPWLLRPPIDFRRRCDAVEAAAYEGEAVEAMLRHLANHALDLTQLTRLGKTVARCAPPAKLAGLTPFTLGVISNGTTSLLVAPLIVSALRHKVVLQVIEAPFDQAAQWALDPTSPLHAARPNAVLLALDHRIIPVPRDPADRDEAEAALATALSFIGSIRNGLRAGCGAPAIVQTLPAPPEALLGNYDARLPGSRRTLVERFNTDLVASCTDSSDVLFDAAAIAQSIGLENWHDETQWFVAKLPFAQSAVPLYTDHIARIVAAMRGKSRKCLVFDLDNTLWGGVVGDDGPDGITIGQGSPTGEAFLELQLTALMLRRLGIVLAVSSKNDDAIARQPFKNHPDMVLRESDIAVFQANWEDKATNLEAVAEALEIGIDTLVLVDDNPAERAQVRDALPDVAVPELPDDPALFRRTLLAAGYFEAVAFSDEDRIRADQYRANSQRRELAGRTRNLDEFLRSLEMVISFAPLNEGGRGRVAQLVNKSNQFNLTTRRYTEANLAAMELDHSVFGLQARLSDVFGDNGMISVVICCRADSSWEIDTWVMSCRVLGRRVQEAILAEIVANARTAGMRTLIGRYIPTQRNGLVRDHYEKLGFNLVREDASGASEWALDVAGYGAVELPMRVQRAETSRAA